MNRPIKKVCTRLYQDQWKAIPGDKAEFTREAIDLHLERYGVFMQQEAPANVLPESEGN
jgi:hypothetical protein